MPKDTARNIRLSHEFVVNLVDEKTAEAMNRTAATLPLWRERNPKRWPHNHAKFRGETAAYRGIARQSGMCRVGHVANRRQPAGHRPGETHPGAR